MLFSLFLWCVPLVPLWESECNAGKGGEHVVLSQLCSHMLPGLGGGGMGASQGVSSLQCIPSSVFWCLFAPSCAVPSIWGVASLQEHAVHHCSQWQERGGGGEHVCTLVWWHQSKDGRGCFFLGCTGIVVVMWLKCVQTRVWAENGIFGDGWPGGRSCCSLQSGTSLLMSPLICLWGTGCLDKLFLFLLQSQQSACWGRRLLL